MPSGVVLAAGMWGYRASEVARLLGLSVEQVRSYVRDGFIAARRGPRGELRFNFQDLVLLRTASGLLAARVPSRRIRRALKRLKTQLPEGKSLSQLHIVARGEDVVVREGAALYEPESGQAVFDFDVSRIVERVAPLVSRAVRASRDGDGMSADDWFAWASDLEDASPAQAREAYGRAVELDPDHADSHVNLGRLLHESGDTAGAEKHYRRALAVRPDDATAHFNLGVLLEDARRFEEALQAYESAIAHDQQCADAYFNAARLYERAGKKTHALRHLGTYRRLTRGR